MYDIDRLTKHTSAYLRLRSKCRNKFDEQINV
jgi:hypothetical protein